MGIGYNWRWRWSIWVSYRYYLVYLWQTCFLKCHFMVSFWWRDILRNFWCALICRYDATNGYLFTFGLGSRYVGHSSVLIRECVGRLHAIRCYVRLDSVLNRPWIGVRSVAELRPTRPRTLPDKTDTTPTYDRQTTDNLSGRDLSNMFERSFLDQCVFPNINRYQTDKIESIPIVSRSRPKFDDFLSVWGRFRASRC